MYVKPVTCNMMLYYGVFTNEAEISNILHVKKLKLEDFYGYIYSRDLQFQRVGNSKNSKELVVGKQLDYYNDFVAMKIMHVGSEIKCTHMNGKDIKLKLTSQEENEVNTKLLELGFFPNTNYYLFHNYDSKLIK